MRRCRSGFRIGMGNWQEARDNLRAAILDILVDGHQSLTTIQERLQSRRIVVSTVEVRDALRWLDRHNKVVLFTNRNRAGVRSKFQDMEVLYELIGGK